MAVCSYLVYKSFANQRLRCNFHRQILTAPKWQWWRWCWWRFAITNLCWSARFRLRHANISDEIHAAVSLSCIWIPADANTYKTDVMVAELVEWARISHILETGFIIAHYVLFGEFCLVCITSNTYSILWIVSLDYYIHGWL